MKTSRLVLGIISMVLFLIIMFQSCAAGVVEVIDENEESTASVAGVFVALMLLTTGIVAVCTRKSIPGGFVCGGLYLLAGIIGLAGHGIYEDLIVWSIVSIIFAIVFIIESIIMIKKAKKEM